jgi:hypothetical protein
MKEAELLELPRLRATFDFRRCHRGHHTSLRKVKLRKGCGSVEAVVRNGACGPDGTLAEWAP